MDQNQLLRQKYYHLLSIFLIHTLMHQDEISIALRHIQKTYFIDSIDSLIVILCIILIVHHRYPPLKWNFQGAH